MQKIKDGIFPHVSHRYIYIDKRQSEGEAELNKSCS